MTTYTSIRQYQKALAAKQKAIPKLTTKAAKKTCNKIKKTARMLAPRSSGNLIRGIRVRPNKGKGQKGWSVESYVPGAFKYNLFVNRDAPYRVLHFRKANQPFYKKGSYVEYGKSARTPGGHRVRWTGKPGFWDKSVREHIPEFRNEAKVAMRKAIRMRG